MERGFDGGDGCRRRSGLTGCRPHPDGCRTWPGRLCDALRPESRRALYGRHDRQSPQKRGRRLRHRHACLRRRCHDACARRHSCQHARRSNRMRACGRRDVVGLTTKVRCHLRAGGRGGGRHQRRAPQHADRHTHRHALKRRAAARLRRARDGQTAPGVLRSRGVNRCRGEHWPRSDQPHAWACRICRAAPRGPDAPMSRTGSAFPLTFRRVCRVSRLRQ